MLNTPDALHRALINWVVSHGTLMGTFGPAGGGNTTSPSVEAHRAALAVEGIDYDASTVGDLGGQEWCDNTYDEAHPHPGMWADVVSTKKHSPATGRWFVPGENHTLSEVILDILTATE